jgi:hypothetical protein
LALKENLGLVMVSSLDEILIGELEKTCRELGEG